MITRRKFLRAGALFLPAAAMGQIAVPNRRVFVNPACSGTNFTAADFEPWRYNSGCGWNGLPLITSVTGEVPQFKTRQMQNCNRPCLSTIGYSWERKLIIGNDWSQIRIGWLIQSDATAGTFIYNLRLGMINNLKAWNTAGCNFIGMQLGGGSNWTYSVGEYVTSGANEVFGSTNVSTANSSAQQLLGATNVATADSFHRNLGYVELTKGSPNYTVECYVVRAASEAKQDMTEKDLDYGLGLASGGAMSISGIGLAYGASTMAFSETNGNLDTVIAYFDATGTSPTNLFAVAAKKIS